MLPSVARHEDVGRARGGVGGQDGAVRKRAGEERLAVGGDALGSQPSGISMRSSASSWASAGAASRPIESDARAEDREERVPAASGVTSWSGARSAVEPDDPVTRLRRIDDRSLGSTSEVACKPSSVPLSRGWSSIWDAGCPTSLAADPKAGRRTPVRLAPHVPSYLALHQVELARFTRSAEAEPTRLCGAGPRLAADGSYPLPCVVVLGLSSGDGLPRHTRPSSHLTGRRTLPPASVDGREPPGRSVAWRPAASRSAAWRSTAWRSTAWRSTAWRSTAWRSTAWRPQLASTAWRSTAWRSTAWVFAGRFNTTKRHGSLPSSCARRMTVSRPFAAWMEAARSDQGWSS